MSPRSHRAAADPELPDFRAFTLIELLVVISIIGLLAGMLVGLAPVAAMKIKESRVRAELQQLVTAIEAYKTRFGVYPPDGLRQVNIPPDGLQTIPNPALSPLFYELSGVAITNASSPNGRFLPLTDSDDVDGIASGEVLRWFGREGFINAKPHEQRTRIFSVPFKESQYAEVFRRNTDAGYVDLDVLAVGYATDASGKRGNGFPWPPGRTDQPVPSNPGLNPWRYVSTNPTNNPGSFDLWAEIPVGRDRIRIIGNWKESN
jgi:prepilin-type N-terminal cleavage/methylation domain-containing protein